MIRGQIEILARQAEPPAEEVRRVERLVLTEVTRMQRLVEDLLLVARAEQPQFLHRQAVELTAFVDELFEGVRGTADRRFELSEIPAVTLDADPDRLAQALRNVLRNAIEHTGSGGLIRLSVEASGECVRFSVDDDGPGIPLEQRTHVFDRFHRTDRSRTRAGGGAGLGLAIVRAIVEAHGGEVAIDASPEGGARVSIRLDGVRPSAAERPLYSLRADSSS